MLEPVDLPMGICPECKKHYTDKLNVESILELDSCLSCDHNEYNSFDQEEYDF